MKTLTVIKIGGNVIDDAVLLNQFIKDFAQIKTPKILVHGGGKMATHLAGALSINQTMIEGRRVTDEETLKVVSMVYAGLINKQIVSKLQSECCDAIGLSGADAGIISGVKRQHPTIDYGFVGDIRKVDGKQIVHFIESGLTPVICPIIHDGNGQLLNTNADTIATQIALALKDRFRVNLGFCFEKKGVLQNPEDNESFIPQVNQLKYKALKQEGIITKGMIPKLDNAFEALGNGLEQVSLFHAAQLSTLNAGFIGTQIVP